jgi:hypothetical protein
MKNGIRTDADTIEAIETKMRSKVMCKKLISNKSEKLRQKGEERQEICGLMETDNLLIEDI